MGKRNLIKVSVVIPIYNVEKYIEDCLASVSSQTLQEMEIICIDDQSADGSVSKVRKFMEKDSRILLLQNNENRGLSYSRNRGLQAACGEYVYFLDSDDMIKDEALDCLYREAENKKLDVIFFDADLIYEEPEFVCQYKNYLAVRNGNYTGVMQGVDLFDAFMKNHEWSPSVPRQFWNRYFLIERELQFLEGIIHEDEIFSLKAILQAGKAMYTPERFFIRRFRRNSIMTSRDAKKSILGYFTIYYRMNQFLRETGIYRESAEVYLAQIYVRLVGLYDQYPQKPVLAETMLEEEIRDAFYFFEAVQNENKAYGKISEKALEMLRNRKKIYIFGAGIVAKYVYRKLVERGMIIHGFIVSSLEDNPKAFMGHPVSELEDMVCSREDAVVVIALGNSYRNEIKKKLSSAGLRSIIYDEEYV